MPIVLQPEILPPELHRRKPHHIGECAGEILRLFKTELVSDLIHLHISLDQ